jgi:hypothetical protein
MSIMAKKNASGTHEEDAIAMLISDHQKVKGLFADFNKLGDDGSDEDKSAIV